MATLDQDGVLQSELKKKRICRFCLSQDYAKLSHIYMRDTRIRSSAPLPIQIMAIASIEVSYSQKAACIAGWPFVWLALQEERHGLANTHFFRLFCLANLCKSIYFTERWFY